MNVSNSALCPARALVHPLWLGSLLLLAVNDHVLKGAGWLPSAITGKLSDVAGLIVAPVVFAVVMRVRTQRGLVVAFGLVGGVFAAIQLSAAAASAWSGLMGAVAMPWVITRDVTDLWTLPVLLLAWWGLRPAMSRPLVSTLRSATEACAGAVGLVCCVATSPADPPWSPMVRGEVFLHNASDDDVVVTLAPTRANVQLDCDAVADAPGVLLQPESFHPGRSYSLDAGTNLSAWPDDELGWEDDGDDDDDGPLWGVRECHAVRVAIDGTFVRTLFWRAGEFSETTIDLAEVPTTPGSIRMRPMAKGVWEFDAERSGLVHHHEPLGFGEGVCAAQPDAARLGWTAISSHEAWHLGAVDVSPDGCLGLTLRTPEQLAAEADGERMYVCMPADSFPFVAGDWVRVMSTGQHAPNEPTPPHQQLQIVALADGGGELASPALELALAVGDRVPVMHGLSAAAVQRFECAYVEHDACGTAARPVALQMFGDGWAPADVNVQSPVTLSHETGALFDVVLVHGLWRTVVDPDCAKGPGQVGHDLELVAVYRGSDSGDMP